MKLLCLRKKRFRPRKLNLTGYLKGIETLNFFHSSTMARRRRTHILALKNAHGEWIHDSRVVQQMVKEFFMDLYCEVNSCSPFPLSGGFPSLP